MSKHLFGIAVTPLGTAANNRGENEGNLTTLQKILWNGQVHTTVSAEAIRWAIRYLWQMQGQRLNRSWNESLRTHEWRDPKFAGDDGEFIDDDVLGFMSAEAARQETTPEPAAGTHRQRARGTTSVRRARLEVTRAISLTPWSGDVTFNAASVGATPSASSTGKDPVPYMAEIHATRYQYGFALTPESLDQPARSLAVLDALINLHDVAGNHGRFLYDFSPETVVFRWSDDFAPRMLYAFESGDDGKLGVPELIRRVEGGDVEAAELVLGGGMNDSPDAQRLAALGVAVFPGVKAAAQEIGKRLRRDLSLTSAA